MENRIVPLNEHEYNKLNEKASLNDSQIKELAEKYYQERGIFRIDITQQLKDFDDCYRSYDVYSFCTENGRYKEEEFKPIISQKDRKRINALAEKIVREQYEKKYGPTDAFLKEANKEIKLFRIVKYVLYGIALSGWGVAGGMIACNIFK